MSEITYIAKFSPSDAPAQILADLCCPACGHRDPGDPHVRVSSNRVRIFCDCCGAFATVVLSDEQANAVHRCAATVPAIEAPTLRTRPAPS